MKPEIRAGQEHDWVKDVDGADVCDRDGCTVRRYAARTVCRWQRKKGAHWREVASEPIPPCRGKDAPPEAKAEKSAAVQLVELAVEAGLPVRYVPSPPEAKAERNDPPEYDGTGARELWCSNATPKTKAAINTACVPACDDSGHSFGCASPAIAMPAPSPLEVVRNLLNQYVPAHSLERGRRALATLEESIRADEREKCARVVDLATGISNPDKRRLSDAIRRRK